MPKCFTYVAKETKFWTKILARQQPSSSAVADFECRLGAIGFVIMASEGGALRADAVDVMRGDGRWDGRLDAVQIGQDGGHHNGAERRRRLFVGRRRRRTDAPTRRL